MKKEKGPTGMKESPVWQDVGFCGFCLMSIEALIPGGRSTRHKSTLTPYGQCPQAIQARTIKTQESK